LFSSVNKENIEKEVVKSVPIKKGLSIKSWGMYILY